VLIDCSPQPVAFTVDLQQHLVEVPLVAGSHSSSTPPCAYVGPNLAHHWRMVS
jgi:hypothetical protein